MTILMIALISTTAYATLPLMDPRFQWGIEMPEPSVTAKEAIAAVRREVESEKNAKKLKDYATTSIIFTRWSEAIRWTDVGAFPVTRGRKTEDIRQEMWLWFVTLRNKKHPADGIFFMLDKEGKVYRGPEKLYNHDIKSNKP